MYQLFQFLCSLILMFYLLVPKTYCLNIYNQILLPLNISNEYRHIELNENGSILGVSVNKKNIQIYKINEAQTEFKFLQQLNPNGQLGTSQSFLISRSSQLLIYLDNKNSKIYVYSIQADGKFVSTPSANISVSNYPFNADLGGQLLCVISNLTNKISLYKVTQNYIEFIQNLIVTHASSVSPYCCEVSQDQKTVIIGFNSLLPLGLQVFTYNGSQFVFNYAVLTKEKSIKAIELSDDSQTLIATGAAGAQVFIKNCTTNKYSSLGLLLDRISGAKVEIIANGLYVFAQSWNAKTVIFQRQSNLQYNEIQTLEDSSNASDISVSKNAKFLAVGFYNGNNQIPKIYKLNCSKAPQIICSFCFYPCQTCLSDRKTCLTYSQIQGSNSDLQCKGCSANCKQCVLNTKTASIICQFCKQNYILNQQTKKCIFKNCEDNYNFDERTKKCVLKFEIVISVAVIIISTIINSLLIICILKSLIKKSPIVQNSHIIDQPIIKGQQRNVNQTESHL